MNKIFSLLVLLSLNSCLWFSSSKKEKKDEKDKNSKECKKGDEDSCLN